MQSKVKKRIIVLHDTNGKPYYSPLEKISDSIKYYESSIIRLAIRGLLRRYKFCSIAISAYRNILFRVSAFWKKNNIVICGMAPFDFRLCYYYLLSKRNKFVLHTSFPSWDVSRVPRRYLFFTRFIKNIWKKILLSEQISIACVTKATKRTIESELPRKKEIFQIYHSVDLDVFFPLNRSSYFNRIVFMGNLIPEKGIKLLLDLANYLKKDGKELLIIGEGQLKFKVTNSNAIYLGYISDRKRIARILQSCDVILQPSLKTKKWEELFGISIIEGMACGAVPIASNHVGPSEIISDGIDGFLVKENSLKEIEERINIIYSNFSLFLRLSQEAVEKAKLFSVEIISSVWEDLICEPS